MVFDCHMASKVTLSMKPDGSRSLHSTFLHSSSNHLKLDILLLLWVFSLFLSTCNSQIHQGSDHLCLFTHCLLSSWQSTSCSAGWIFFFNFLNVSGLNKILSILIASNRHSFAFVQTQKHMCIYGNNVYYAFYKCIVSLTW